MNEIKMCPSCGKPVGQTDVFCQNCGFDVRKARQAADAAAAVGAAAAPAAAAFTAPAQETPKQAPQYQAPQYQAPQYQAPQQTVPQYQAPQTIVYNNAPSRLTVNDLPPELKPISPWGYIGYTLLFGIPIVGFILMLVFSFSNGNINKKNYARSFFIMFIIAVAVFLAILLIVLITGNAISGSFKR